VKIVLCNGCFDPLHPGHVSHLREARGFGDRLIVALTLDSHINKGPKRPYLTWEERASMLDELRCVDAVVQSENGWASVLQYRPQVFAKGEDWRGRMPQATLDACKEVGAEIVFTSTPRFGTAEMVRRLTR
jgi:cytidyltransferase-like protein